jgi:quercetin dioxygenase-like cupin family protein
MKKLFTLLPVLALCFSAQVVRSQDMSKVDPVHCKVLNDTANVRLILVTLHPGDKLPLHSHPTWIFYSLTGGKIGHVEQGKTTTLTLEPGMHAAGVSGPAHEDVNLGNTDVSFLVVEITPKSK